MVRHSRPWIEEVDVAAVAATLRSGNLAGGEQVVRFERELAHTVGQAGGVATSSGTAALHLALRARGIGPGDEVLLPSYVCTAVLNAVHHAQATPVLCDVAPDTGALHPDDARGRLTRRTWTVIVAHLFGHPADLEGLDDLEVPVIEDCAQALGAEWQGRQVGSFGSISIFSFYATKVISTGEGGMACSSSPVLLERMRAGRDYDQRDDYEVRYNYYKMCDFQASLGRSQLRRLPEALAARRRLAERYTQALTGLEVDLPPTRAQARPRFYRYVIQTAETERLLAEFAARGVECKRPVYRPLHHYLNGSAPLLPNAERVYQRALSLPLYPTLRREEADRVTQAARELLGGERRAAAREHSYVEA